MAVFGERLRDDPTALALQCAALVAVAGGMVLVSRSTALGRSRVFQSHGLPRHDHSG